jgi:hypothetical protein
MNEQHKGVDQGQLPHLLYFPGNCANDREIKNFSEMFVRPEKKPSCKGEPRHRGIIADARRYQVCGHLPSSLDGH